MVQHLCKDFLSDEAAYRAAQVRWRQLWDKVVATTNHQAARWQVPWFLPEYANGTPMQDGNPIFSAVSLPLRRGVRIIQHEAASNDLEFSYWLDTFAGDEPIAELVISCALSDQAEERATDLIRSWITGTGVAGNSKPPLHNHT